MSLPPRVDSERVLHELTEAAVLMARSAPSDAIAGLRRARAVVVDHHPSEFWDGSDDGLMVIYLTRKILGDIWVNLGTDATFSVEDVEEPLTELANALSVFLQSALRLGGHRNSDTYSAAIKVVRIYVSAIHAAERSRNRVAL